MVFIEHREGVFDAPIDKVWKLAKAHSSEGFKIHPSAKNVKTEMIDEQVFVNSWEEEEINGQPVKIKMKGTIFYPLGVAFEAIEGPFAGSTYFIHYKPLENNKTNVVVGDFRSQSIDPVVNDDEILRSIVLSKFEQVFYEDCEYLKNI